MGVLGEMFPSRKLRSEAGEAGDGQGWRLGPIDLDAGVVEVHRVSATPVVESDAAYGTEPGTPPDAELEAKPDAKPDAEAAE